MKMIFKKATAPEMLAGHEDMKLPSEGSNKIFCLINGDSFCCLFKRLVHPRNGRLNMYYSPDWCETRTI